MRQRTLIIGSVLLFLVALVSFGLANIARPANRATNAGRPTPAATAVSQMMADQSALPASRPYTKPMQNSADPMVLTVVGEFGNGGAWAWEEVFNLLGIYGTPNVFRRITFDGQQYDGVPLTHLLSYAQINDYAATIAIKDREGQIFDFPALQIRNCFDCLLVLTPENTITLVLPGLTPSMIQPLMRIEAMAQGVFQATAPRVPPDSQSILLFGMFGKTGSWTWEDLSNLLGMYSGYGDFLTVDIEDTTYTGVPLRFLLDFAQLDRAARTLIITDREELRIPASAAAMADCQTCMLALTDDDTISLVLPDMEPNVIPNIANLDAR